MCFTQTDESHKTKHVCLVKLFLIMKMLMELWLLQRPVYGHFYMDRYYKLCYKIYCIWDNFINWTSVQSVPFLYYNFAQYKWKGGDYKTILHYS